MKKCLVVNLINVLLVLKKNKYIEVERLLNYSTPLDNV